MWMFEEQEAAGLKAARKNQLFPVKGVKNARFENCYRQGFMSCHTQDMQAVKKYMQENNATDQEMRQVKTVDDFVSWLSSKSAKSA